MTERSQEAVADISITMPSTPGVSRFEATLRIAGCRALQRQQVQTVQINVGYLCNQACRHCHAAAGPNRTQAMTRKVAQRIVDVTAASPGVELADLTGGAPELNDHFRFLVSSMRTLGKRVCDRCNLTVLLEPGLSDLSHFMADQEVEIIASLPCYTADNVDEQRGRGTFEKSIRVLQNLNKLGYGRPNSRLRLDLAHNSLGASLPPSQATLEADYRQQLRDRFGIEFHRLLTITNMPINRFAHRLRQNGTFDEYTELLARQFNAATLDRLMCRSLVNIGWDGRLCDCDFNQMLGLGLGGNAAMTIWGLDCFSELSGARIATGTHCFGCTAGHGSSCGGALQ